MKRIIVGVESKLQGRDERFTKDCTAPWQSFPMTESGVKAAIAFLEELPAPERYDGGSGKDWRKVALATTENNAKEWMDAYAWVVDKGQKLASVRTSIIKYWLRDRQDGDTVLYESEVQTVRAEGFKPAPWTTPLNSRTENALRRKRELD